MMKSTLYDFIDVHGLIDCKPGKNYRNGFYYIFLNRTGFTGYQDFLVFIGEQKNKKSNTSFRSCLKTKNKKRIHSLTIEVKMSAGMNHTIENNRVESGITRGREIEIFVNGNPVLNQS